MDALAETLIVALSASSTIEVKIKKETNVLQ